MLFPALVAKEDLGTPFSRLLLQGEAQADLLLVFQDGIVGLVDVLGHFRSSALQGELQREEERLVVVQGKAGASTTSPGRQLETSDLQHGLHTSWMWPVTVNPSISALPPKCLFRACYKQEEVHESKLPLWGSQIP